MNLPSPIDPECWEVCDRLRPADGLLGALGYRISPVRRLLRAYEVRWDAVPELELRQRARTDGHARGGSFSTGASPVVWRSFVLASIAIPALLPFFLGFVPRRRGIAKRMHARAVAMDLVLAVSHVAVAVTMLAHQAWLTRVRYGELRLGHGASSRPSSVRRITRFLPTISSRSRIRSLPTAPRPRNLEPSGAARRADQRRSRPDNRGELGAERPRSVK